MPSPEQTPSLSAEGRAILLDLAYATIRHGLTSDQPMEINSDDYPAELQAKRASFVTLNRHGALRGCIGHLEAMQPLVVDVVESAYSAAFRDPRFPRLTEAELPGLDIHISALTPSQPLVFESEQDLISKLRPGVDGLILVEGRRRGTFLPSVWASLPTAEQFLQHLKLKAGLPADYWSESIRMFRYETESFGG